MKNPRYLPNKKNNYNPPIPTDPRTLYVAIGCGHCIECKTQKARQWQIRLIKELEVHKYAYFVTLTFSNESLEELCKENKTTECNAVASIAVRRFLERYRKKYKVSLKHWLITELGHNNTERIHLHGIIFPNEEMDNETLQKFWGYGMTYTGDYCNAKTINYIIKYVTKIDSNHKGYEAIILCSAGLGKNGITDTFKNIHKYEEGKTKEYIKLPNGQKVNMPIYYRNKTYTEEEREKLWIDRLNKGSIYVRGIEVKNIDTEEGQKKYMALLKEQQKQNIELGYGDDTKRWKNNQYNQTLRMLNRNPKKT